MLPALLVMIDALPSVTLLHPLAQHLGHLDGYELLPDYVLALLQHSHGIGIRSRGIEVIRSTFIEFLLLVHHLQQRSIVSPDPVR
ncbi:hypothetical protein Mapa_000961 [Marchantia paleacea]|nr:hypothetical protein Mapa_000961 [Marchantia paleacea]